MKTNLLTLLSVIAVGLLAGCGSGSNDSPTTQGTPDILSGQFIDSAVSGLGYSCSSDTSGVTDNEGRFSCLQGDTVSFNINGYQIGSALMADIITPRTLHPNDDGMAINIAQLLQTLDSDVNTSNGINLDPQSQEVEALLGADVLLDQADFDSAITTYIGLTLVDETTATAHLEESIAALSGLPEDPADTNNTVNGDTVIDNNIVNAFNSQYLTRYQNAQSGELIWENRGILASNLITDSNENIYIQSSTTILFDFYNLGIVSLDPSGSYRWMNSDLTLYSEADIAGNNLYNGNMIIDTQDGSLSTTLSVYVRGVLADGSYLAGEEKTTVTGNGSTAFYNAQGDVLWNADYGAPKAVIDNYVLTGEATLNLIDGSYYSNTGLNERYSSDMDHRLYGKDIWDADSDRLVAKDVRTGESRIIMDDITEAYDYSVAEKQNIFIYYAQETKEMIAYDTLTFSELWRRDYTATRSFHEAITFSPDQSRFYFETSTSGLLSFDTLSGDLLWSKDEICNAIIGFNQTDGTIYCKSRYATSVDNITGNYVVAIKP